MSNRLRKTIARARKYKSKLFCAYVTLGFPTLSRTEDVVLALERAGTSILELGFPFSDPLADGPTIQHSSEQAIRGGVRIEDAFKLMRKLRKKGFALPVLFFSYLNPIVRHGVERTLSELKRSGFDGLIVPDLPIEEGSVMEQLCRLENLSLVYLAAPTTSKKRMRVIVRRSSEFIYYVSLRGVTGARHRLPSDLLGKLKTIKKMTKKPVLAGFGVSRPEQARSIARVADGIVVGSAIIDRLRKGGNVKRSVFSYVSRLIREMK